MKGKTMSSKTLHRLAAASVATVLLGSSLAACSTEGSSGSTATLTIGTSHEPAVQAAVDAFLKDNPDADIELKVYAQDYRGVIGAQLAGGNVRGLRRSRVHRRRGR